MSDDCEFSTGALTKERIAQFSVAMQDPNPVHLDPSFCASIGLPGIIAPGGIGVVADDLAASVYGNLALQILIRWLGI